MGLLAFEARAWAAASIRCLLDNWSDSTAFTKAAIAPTVEFGAALARAVGDACAALSEPSVDALTPCFDAFPCPCP